MHHEISMLLFYFTLQGFADAVDLLLTSEGTSMNIALWVVSIVLALAFLAAGGVKLIQPKDQLLDKMPWVANATQGQVRTIGALEVLGAVGLVLPAVTGIAPTLVPLAALGLLLLMIGAVVVHVRIGDKVAQAAPAIVLALLCAFVAWGRFGPYPL